MTEQTVEPLNEEERAQLAWLQYRQAMADWQTGEDARLAELVTLAPVVAALGDLSAIGALVGTLETAIDDLADDSATRLSRIVRILRVDGLRLASRHAQLQQPAPQPEPPSVPEPAE